MKEEMQKIHADLIVIIVLLGSILGFIIGRSL